MRSFYIEVSEKNGVEAIFEIKANKRIPELMKYTNSLIQEPQITKETYIILKTTPKYTKKNL